MKPNYAVNPGTTTRYILPALLLVFVFLFSVNPAQALLILPSDEAPPNIDSFIPGSISLSSIIPNPVSAGGTITISGTAVGGYEEYQSCIGGGVFQTPYILTASNFKIDGVSQGSYSLVQTQAGTTHSCSGGTFQLYEYSFSITYNTTGLSNGSHTAVVKADDAATGTIISTGSQTFNVDVGGGSFNLNVNIIGTGTVTSSPAGINCTSTCLGGFAAGTAVTLTATPNSGQFTGDCTGTGSCSITLNADASVTATFGSPDFSLQCLTSSQTVVPSGSASYSLSITPTGGFSGSVTFSLIGAPSGVSAAGTSSLPYSAPSANVSVSSATTPGTYTLTIVGSSGALSHSCTASLIVGSAGGPTINNFSASPSTITAGQSSALTWSSTGATNCTINPGGFSGVSGSGVSTGTLTSTITYILSCTNAGGSVSSATTTVTVNPAPGPLPPTVSITVDGQKNETVDAYAIVDLVWTSTNATSCQLNGITIATSGSQNVNAQTTGVTYHIICAGAAGTAVDTASFAVQGYPTAFLKANNTSGFLNVAAGTTVTLSYGFSPVVGENGFCSLDGSGSYTGTLGFKSLPSGSGTTNVTVNTRTIFTASCGDGTSNGGSTDTVVVDTGITADIKANDSNGPITVNAGTAVSISWTSLNATSCSVSPTGWTGTSNAGINTTVNATTTYTLSCSGFAGTATDSVIVNVRDFTIACTTGSQTVTAGNPANYQVTLSAVNGFNSSVTITANNLPVGASSPGGSAVPPANPSITVNTSSITPPGTYTIAMLGTAGSLQHTCPAQLTVNAGNINAANYVSQSVPTTLNVNQTASATITMKNCRAGGDCSNLNSWTVAGNYALGSQNPANSNTWGVTTVNVPGTVNPGSNQAFTFTITAPAVAGSYNFQWQMKQAGVFFGDLTPNVVINVIAPNFSLTCTPASNPVTAGSSASYSVTVSPSNGFSSAVVLSLQNVNPAAPTITSSGATSNSPYSPTAFPVSTTNATPPQTYTLTIQGIGSGITRTCTVELVVNPLPAPTATLTVNQSANPGPVLYNSSVTLGWTSANVTSCTVTSSPNIGTWTGLAKVDPPGAPTPPLTNDTTFILDCSGLGGSVQKQVAVKVKPADPTGVINQNTALNPAVACNNILISWTAPSGVESYRVFRSPNAPNNLDNTPSNAIQIKDFGNPPSPSNPSSFTYTPGDTVVHYYFVEAYRGNGDASHTSNRVSSNSAVAPTPCSSQLFTEKDIVSVNGVNNSSAIACLNDSGQINVAGLKLIKLNDSITFTIRACNTTGVAAVNNFRFTDTMTNLLPPTVVSPSQVLTNYVPPAGTFNYGTSACAGQAQPTINGTNGSYTLTFFGGGFTLPAGQLCSITYTAKVTLPANTTAAYLRFQNTTSMNGTDAGTGQLLNPQPKTPLILFSTGILNAPRATENVP